MDINSIVQIKKTYIEPDDVLLVRVPKEYISNNSKELINLLQDLTDMLPYKNKIFLIPNNIDISIIGTDRLSDMKELFSVS